MVFRIPSNYEPNKHWVSKLPVHRSRIIPSLRQTVHAYTRKTDRPASLFSNLPLTIATSVRLSARTSVVSIHKINS
jgi:hypothetical protein